MGDFDYLLVLLIMGLGVQMLLWWIDFCVWFVVKGLCVICYDNCDVGLFIKIECYCLGQLLVMWLVWFWFGLFSQVVYMLEDMVVDVVVLFDYFDVKYVYVVGVLMGGMIVQIFVV